VARRTDRTDARLQWVELTPSGARMHAAILPIAQALEEELLAGLSPVQIATLRQALAHINGKLLEEQ